MAISQLTTITPDLYSLKSIIPDHLKDNQAFIDFLEAYFEWLQSDASSPSAVLNSLTNIRDIDEVEEMFLQYLQREFAVAIPNIGSVDRRKLYKQANDIYRSKGSTSSYAALFNLLFNDQVELYFPRVDLLKPSEGKWDSVGGRYLNNNGFLSDTKYIQDSYYYQDFSYVIKTSQTIERWRDIVKKLLHPAGFAFFGQINILITSRIATIKSPTIQPGRKAGEPSGLPLISDVVTFASSFKNINASRVIRRESIGMNKLGPNFYMLEQIKFGLTNASSIYDDLTIEYVSSGVPTNRVPGVEIVIT